MHLIIITLCLASITQISAQPENSLWDNFKDDVSHSFHVGIGILKSPYTASASDWERIGIASAATGAFFWADPEVKTLAQSNQNKTNNWLFGVDDYFDKEKVIPVTSGIYLVGLFSRNERIRVTGLYVMEATFYSSVITYILKSGFGRSRPHTNDDHMTFRFFRGTHGRFRSFPSGHSTSAFAICTVMAKSMENNWWKTFWYGTAVMVGASRIYHNRHWLTDTVLGGFIGYTTTSYVVHFDEKKKQKKIKVSGYYIQPFVTGNKFGLSIHF
jgi:membrane-associated phospholipid phosphatase